MQKQDCQVQQKYENTTQSKKIVRILKPHSQEIQSALHLKAQPMSFGSNEGDEQKLNSGNQRRLCETPGQYPFSAIGVLYVFFSGFVAFGTAFLIQSNILLTAAHNIYNRDSKKAAYQAQIVMDFHENKKTFRAVCAYFPKQYKQKKMPEQASEFDYAIVILENIDIISSQKYKTISLSQMMKQGDQVQIYGYPDKLSTQQFYEDKKKYQIGESKKIPKQKSLFGCIGQLKQLKQRVMLHGVPTSSGQSGSPVLRFNTKSKRYEAIGVHIYGKITSNRALRITGEVHNRINRWIQDFWNQKNNNQRVMLFDGKGFQIAQVGGIEKKISKPRKVRITPDKESWGLKNGEWVIGDIYNNFWDRILGNKNSNAYIVNTDGYCNWLCSSALPFDGEFVFTIKVIKLTEGIEVGVMENDKKGQKIWHTMNYSVYLIPSIQSIIRPNEEQMNFVAIDCLCSSKLPKCPFQIECHVNRQQNTIAWHYDGKQQAKSILPKAWKTNQKQLCAIVYFYNKGDGVQMM